MHSKTYIKTAKNLVKKALDCGSSLTFSTVYLKCSAECVSAYRGCQGPIGQVVQTIQLLTLL